MSEYWKSTPKYWCKHCKTFIRDTKLERTNHDATPKHQGNLKRFLRDLHRGHEKDEKDKERAKAEVARLNGVVSAAGPSGRSVSSSSNTRTPGLKQQSTAADVIRQREQLSEMGVAIPDEFRREMAMVGDWQVTSERILDPDEGERKPDAIGFGVRKRPAEEEDGDAVEAKKGKWGSAYRTHPADNVDDLDALLRDVTSKGKDKDKDGGQEVKNELREDAKGIKTEPETNGTESDKFDEPKRGGPDLSAGIKKEPSDGELAIPSDLEANDKQVIAAEPTTGVVFKKRRAKNFRQK